jgi:DNA-binding winged helix-turn-helix (wHTH) protein
LDNGGDAILTGEDRDLLPKVLTTLARRMRLDAESRAPLKPFDGFVIDRHSHTLSVHNQPVPLTSFEFKFLYLLAEKYPAIVSRDEITENIYSGDLPSSKTIEVFVSRLRKKILPFAINTVLDEGYGLSEKPDLAYQKRSRGFDEEGNELIVVDAIDRYILELAMNSVRFQEISEMVDTRFGSETNRNMIAGRVRDRFGGLRRISAERLVKPATPDGEWLYKRPPR